MYGAMREHAPRSTQLAGAFTALTATLAFGYAMANGLGDYIVKSLPDPIIYVPLPDAPQAEPPPNTDLLDTETAPLEFQPLRVVLDTYVFEDTTIIAKGDRDAQPAPGPLAPPRPLSPPAALVRVSPQLIPAPLPPYPPSEIRKGNEGNSALALCLDTRGKVTSATLAASSGHEALDEAALKWVRRQSFTPAKLDGAPQPVCGHPITYEWRINRH